MKKLILGATAAVLAMNFAGPTEAPARTKTVLKYGAIGLGAYALSQAMQPSYGYYQQPAYYYPAQQSYGYYGYPASGYNYNYGYGYDYGYNPGYYGGYYYGY